MSVVVRKRLDSNPRADSVSRSQKALTLSLPPNRNHVNTPSLLFHFKSKLLMSAKAAEETVSAPKSAYEQRLAAHRGTLNDLQVADGRYATGRGLLFLVGLGIAWFVIIEVTLPSHWLLLPASLFAVLVVGHSRNARQIQHAKRAIDFYERGLDRLDNRWIGVGPSGDRYRNLDHPYSGDLDIFGEGSLFELLCDVRTRLGEDVLAKWLSETAEPDVIRERQAAVLELRDQLDFREELALLDADVHDELDQNQLARWVREEPRPISRKQRTVAIILGFLAPLTLAAWMLGYGLSPFLIIVLIEIAYYGVVLREIRHIGSEADEAGAGLAILFQVLEHLEQQQFSSPLLKKLRASLDTEGHSPSWQIAKLRNLIQTLNNCMQNQFYAPIAFLLGLPVHAVHRVERWRERIGPHIAGWLEAVGQIEAVSSIAGHAFERPEDPFPEIVDPVNGPCFVAEEIGHPLIAKKDCIRNGVRLDGEQRLIMVSGSNMSGKSTLMRTLGINAVLALSGSPVRAKSLKLTPLQIGTAMRVNDSLQQGASLFYQVISRIKSVVELAGGKPPLLYLLDEILQGTNSHDRRVGAEGIIHQLVRQGAIGLVTTHDLALTRIVDSLEGHATNIHFEDHLINGRMYFDYRIRPGVVEKSNALELMRMIGLEVGDDGGT